MLRAALILPPCLATVMSSCAQPIECTRIEPACENKLVIVEGIASTSRGTRRGTHCEIQCGDRCVNVPDIASWTPEQEGHVVRVRGTLILPHPVISQPDATYSPLDQFQEERTYFLRDAVVVDR